MKSVLKNMTYDITDYGAVPGTEALQTGAIQRALDACAAAGGGTVAVPPGVFRTGSLRIGSHTTLSLEKNATFLGPDSMDGYVRHPFVWELYKATTPLLYAVDAEDIRIKGEGTIDFNGRAFARWDKPCNGTDAELPEELRNDPHVEMPPRDERPNRLVFFQSCRDIEISGVAFVDSPTWTLVFHRGNHISIHDLRIENHRRIPNNDGIHCCGCRDVNVARCIISCGDDCIALTSISDASAVTANVEISDCVFQSSSAALRIGFESGKVRNVAVRNCVIRDSNRGVAVFAGRDGLVEDVTLSGLLIETRVFAGTWWGKGEPMVVCATEPGRKSGTSACATPGSGRRTASSWPESAAASTASNSTGSPFTSTAARRVPSSVPAGTCRRIPRSPRPTRKRPSPGSGPKAQPI